MRTLQIENHEIESFIENRYGQDTQSLWQDFATFVKVSLNDNYPGISASQAKRRVENAIREIDNGTATMLTQEAYDKEMNAFMDKL